jgi:hypothetical protein
LFAAVESARACITSAPFSKLKLESALSSPLTLVPGNNVKAFAMSHPYANNWRPPHDGRPRYQNTWGANQNNRRPQKDWTEINNQADDLIAPPHAAISIQSLERWALATSSFLQQGHGRNEAPVIDRIQRRYDSSNGGRDASMPRYSNPNALNSKDEGTSHAELTHGGAVKRSHSPSPPLLGRMQHHQQPRTLEYMQSTKRRRTRSPSPARSSNRQGARAGQVTIDLTEDVDDDDDDDYDYAQSSEWSFPGHEDGDGDPKDLVDLT